MVRRIPQPQGFKLFLKDFQRPGLRMGGIRVSPAQPQHITHQGN